MHKTLRIALLDMNNNEPNLGMKNLVDLVENFTQTHANEFLIQIFDVRHLYETPSIEDFDIFISSGGPGNPNLSGLPWEKDFTDFLDNLLLHNQSSPLKKHAFLICHSFQVALIHWKLAKVIERETYSFGILPIYLTRFGKKDWLFENLDQPFYAVDSRSFQCLQPNFRKMKRLDIKILAIERFRAHRNLSRALMAIRFSDEIIGTQFHPEAEAEDVMCKLVDENYKQKLIEKIGLNNYLETLDRADDEDKIKKTQAEILPKFLHNAVNCILQKKDNLL